MDIETAYKTLRGMWLKLVDHGIKAKKDFQDAADECMRFFNGPYDFLYQSQNGQKLGSSFLFSGEKRMPQPSICMTVNKVAEGVQLFGPAMYQKNPVRKSNPRKLPKLPEEMFGDPNNPQTQMMWMPLLQQMQQQNTTDKIRGALLEWYLNYLPEATNLKRESRRQIDEGLIKGMGCVWTSVWQPDGAKHRMPFTEQDSVNNLLLDPDQDKIENAQWIMRRRCKPTWEVEKLFGHAPGSLKGNGQSGRSWAANQSVEDETVGDGYKKKTGKTNDLIVYWEIWSKMGIGSLMAGIDPGTVQLDKYGRYLYIVVSDAYPFLLNIPQAMWNYEPEVQRRLQWETPYWADDGWPVSPLIFHEVPNSIWPMSHFRPALGELQFINWAYSFLISKIERCSRDFIAIAKAAGEELKHKILTGGDLTLLEFEQGLGGSIDKIVGFLQHPPFHQDIYKVIQAVETNFEKRTGLTELMYGESSRQLRSASEADLKAGQLQVRPDDMANCVEETATEVARKEALTARWHLDGSDIAPVFGPVMANMWQQYVATADISAIVHQLEYRIESGSAKRPNKDKDADDANQAMQTLMPVLQQYAMAAGDIEPVNALIAFWGQALDVNVDKMMLKPPPAPAPAPAGPVQGGQPA